MNWQAYEIVCSPSRSFSPSKDTSSSSSSSCIPSESIASVSATVGRSESSSWVLTHVEIVRLVNLSAPSNIESLLEEVRLCLLCLGVRLLLIFKNEIDIVRN